MKPEHHWEYTRAFHDDHDDHDDPYSFYRCNSVGNCERLSTETILLYLNAGERAQDTLDTLNQRLDIMLGLPLREVPREPAPGETKLLDMDIYRAVGYNHGLLTAKRVFTENTPLPVPAPD